MEREGLHGQFLRKTESTDDGNRWEWLKQGELKHERESLFCAAQEQALSINAINLFFFLIRIQSMQG